MPFHQVLPRVRLELPSNICRTVLRVALDEQVYVVISDLQRQTLVSEVVGSLRKQLPHIVFNHVENRVSILRVPEK